MKIFFFEIAEEYPGFVKAGISVDNRREIRLVMEQDSNPYVYTGHRSLKDFQRIDFTAEQAAALAEFIESGRGTAEYWPAGV